MAAATILGAGGLQLLPNPPRSNPAVVPSQTIEANLRVPKHVSNMIGRACANCHSNQTQWPWYSRVAPLSWMIHKDVIQARQVLNFSEFRSAGDEWPGSAMGMLAAACAALDSGTMPPASYVLMHPEARLSRSDKQMFCEWTRTQMSTLAMRSGERKGDETR